MLKNYIHQSLLEGKIGLQALSWKEPYASLMLRGKIETRTWKTNYRGLVLICASQKNYSTLQVKTISGYDQMLRIAEAIGQRYHGNMGHAIAIGNLTDCRPMKKEDADKCYVKFNPKLYCHIYENIMVIEKIPWKGKLGFTKVPHKFIEKIKFL